MILMVGAIRENGKTMDKYEVAKKLMRCFPQSFINYRGEFIAHQKSNTYFIFDYCEDEQEVNCKVLEWLSRAAHKTAPFRTAKLNNELHQFVLDGINSFLGTDFTFYDMDLIYTYLGNAVNRNLTIKFVESGYDMEVLREYERKRRTENA